MTSAALGDLKAVKMLGLSPVCAAAIQKLRAQEIKASALYRRALSGVVLLCKLL